MSANSVRCANCGKRVAANARLCPACGVEQTLHAQRIHCHYCGGRIRADFVLCPLCDHDPRKFYWRRQWRWGIVAAAIALAGAGAFLSTPLWRNALSSNDALPPPPTPLISERVVTVIVVVTPQATATVAPSATATLTPTPTPSATPTVTPTRGARTPPPTRTSTAAPTSARLPAPILLAPADGENIIGAKRAIMFAFQPAAPLAASQWYRVQVDFRDRANHAVSWCGWAKETLLRFPPNYFDDASPTDRLFRWQVDIAQFDAGTPSTCNAPATIISAPGVTRAFYWY